MKKEKFEKLSKEDVKKLSKEEQGKYYRALRDYYEKHRWIENLTYEQRNKIHKLLVPLFKFNTKINGQKVNELEIVYDDELKKLIARKLNKKIDNIDPNRPIIFVINHVGKFDVEKVGEVIKKPFFLLSGDFENLHDKFDGIMIGINGVKYYDMNNKEDTVRIKKILTKLLFDKQNIIWCIEQTWNFSENQLVLDSKFGVIEIAKKTNAQIIPVGILQYDKDFYVIQGDVFEVNKYFEENNNEYIAKKEAIRDLKDTLATLMWYIMEYDMKVNGKADRNELVENGYWDKYIDDRLKEWTFSLEDVLEKRFFDPDKVREEDVYSFLLDINYNKDNLYLLRNDDNKRNVREFDYQRDKKEYEKCLVKKRSRK